MSAKEISERLFVLYCIGSVSIDAITMDDPHNLDEILDMRRFMHPELEWKVANLHEYGWDCFQSGVESEIHVRE